ncbi:MAG: nitrous oxide reductase accessory protein NosL [Thermodesulfobacteriota bacterium]
MKALAVLGAALAAIVSVVLFLWPAPASGPQQIAYGRDTCARCRMILSRPGFAGEVRDADGALAKYDDVGCMLDAMRVHRGPMPEAWVEDHAGGGFVPLLTATLVRAPAVDTPMGHGLVAFADAAEARAFAARHGGALIALEDVVRAPDRLALQHVPRRVEEPR